MARLTRPLTNTEIQKAKAAETDISLYDGEGLLLLIKPSGKKLWRFRYQRPTNKKRTTISLGYYPYVSLADARQKRSEYLILLAKGIDPQIDAKEQQEQTEIEQESIFTCIAEKWFQLKQKQVKPDYAKDIWRSLEKDILPSIGNLPVQQIKARTLIQALEPIRARGALETLRRLIQRINEIMIYAINTGLLDANPASGISYAFEKPKKQHMPTLKPAELPQLMSSLIYSNLALPTRLLIEWQLLTMVRPSEAAEAKWEEINWDKKEWHIPAYRMKAKKSHVVPLSEEALMILEKLKPVSWNSPFIFSSRLHLNKPMNTQTANAALKRIGYANKLVAHGLRALASTVLNEEGFNPDVIEAALAHGDKNEVRAAYNRATYLEQRRELMQWWGKYVYANNSHQ